MTFLWKLPWRACRTRCWDVLALPSRFVLVRRHFRQKPWPFMARQLIQERLRGLDLPPGVEPELAPPATATGEIFRYVLRARDAASELRAIQDWKVSRQLKQVPVSLTLFLFGGPIRRCEVRPRSGRLRDYKLTLGSCSMRCSAPTPMPAAVGGAGQAAVPDTLAWPAQVFG